MIEHGLVDSSHYRPKSSVSEDLSLVESVPGAEEFVSVSVTDIADASLEVEGEETSRDKAEAPSSSTSTEGDNNHLKPPSRTSPESSESEWETLDPSILEEGGGVKEAVEGKEAGSEHPETFDPQPGIPITVQPQSAAGQGVVTQGLVSGLDEDQYGLPLAIFTKVKLLCAFYIHESCVSVCNLMVFDAYLELKSVSAEVSHTCSSPCEVLRSDWLIISGYPWTEIHRNSVEASTQVLP